MSQNYDFKKLSPIDFEELCRDLLQKELDITFESFTEGRDGGIDFRYSQGEDQIILQCKRYTKDSFPSLETELKKEVSKVQQLNPSRYILMTSFGLTPPNEETILELFTSYILSTSDIYGKNDINNLIGKYEEIEKKHYKLWFESTSILSQLLHSDIHARSKAKLEEIKEKLNIYVINDSYGQAIDILNNYNYCVISGVPGIGKTTLADLLTFQYIQEDFEFCFVSNNISEAWKLLQHDKKQIFYFDDFLGRNFLEDRLEKNEDDDIIRFIEAIKKDSRKKFILTTREYILNQAKHIYRKLDNEDLALAQCTIDLGRYTKQIKAKIFYNHLYYSGLNTAYLDAVLKSKVYFKVIDHKNYNPRLISFIANKKVEQVTTADNYPKYLLEILDNPEKIWQEAFDKLTRAAQCLLYSLTISSDQILLKELKEAFLSLYRSMAKEYNFQTSPNDFRNAVKELENNFIKSFIDDDHQTIISFHNPSIRDFLITHINLDDSLKTILIQNLIYFNQAFYIFVNSNKKKKLSILKKIELNDELEKLLALKAIELTKDVRTTSIKIYYASDSKRVMKPNNPNLAAQLWSLHDKFSSNHSVQQHIINTLKSSNIFEVFIKSGQDKLNFLKLLNIYFKDRDKETDFAFLDYLKDDNISYNEDIECILFLKNSLKNFDEYFAENIDYFMDSVESYANDMVYAIDEHYDGSDIVNLIEEFNEKLHVDVDYDSLKERSTAAADAYYSNEDLAMEQWREEKFEAQQEDNYIDSMFDTLSDSKS